MAVFVGCKFIVYLTISCLVSLLHAQDPLTERSDRSEPDLGQADGSTPLPDEIGSQENYRATRIDYGMFARTETTPYECSRGLTCGFQPYDQLTRIPVGEYIHYCHCLDGQVCTQAGDNMQEQFWFYKCRNATTETSTEPMSTDPSVVEQTSDSPFSSRTEETETSEAVDTSSRTEATETSEGVDTTSTESHVTSTLIETSYSDLQKKVGYLKEHAEL